MNILKNIFIRLGISIATFLIFSGWYTTRLSMKNVVSVGLSQDNYNSTVLITTQGSEYKDALVNGVVGYLKPKPDYIKVTDVNRLLSVGIESWDAILIFHTLEMSKPPHTLSKFVEKNYNSDKVCILSTSISSKVKIDDAGSLTGASRMEELSTHLSPIISFLDDTLNLSQVGKSSLNQQSKYEF